MDKSHIGSRNRHTHENSGQRLIEFSHHAVISMTSGEKIIIDEGPHEIIRKVIEYKRAINSRGIEIRAGNTQIEAI